MASINTKNVVLGGLLAGLVIAVVETVANEVVLSGANSTVLAKLGLEEPGGAAIAGFIAVAFFLGLLIAWLYVGLRPTYSGGPRAGVAAGVAVWVAGGAAPTASWALMGAYTGGHAVSIAAYTLVEFVAAGLVASAVYRKAAVGAADSPARPF